MTRLGLDEYTLKFKFLRKFKNLHDTSTEVGMTNAIPYINEYHRLLNGTTHLINLSSHLYTQCGRWRPPLRSKIRINDVTCPECWSVYGTKH